MMINYLVFQVYLVGHMPPGVDERENGGILLFQDIFQERFNERYLRLVRKYSDIIVGQFFGHLHSDSFRVIYSDDGRLIVYLILTHKLKAISPYHHLIHVNGSILFFCYFYLTTSKSCFWCLLLNEDLVATIF